MPDLDEYPVVTENAESFLNHRQLLDYRAEREDCLRWLLTYGKKPDEAAGYAGGTVKPRSYRMDRFYRFVWEFEGGYTASLTHEHADAWMDHLAHRDVSATHKRNCQKSLKILYKWLQYDVTAEKTKVWVRVHEDVKQEMVAFADAKNVPKSAVLRAVLT